MKNKYSFTDLVIIVWAVILPTTLSMLVIIVYLKELDKITFIDNTLMKIAYVVSVLHLVIMLGIVMSSIINDIKEIKKIRFYRKHPEEREKRQAKTLDEYKKLFEELDKKINEEKEKNKNEKTNN